MPGISHFNYRYASLPEIQTAFLHTGEALCDEIESYQPDLLISLMHSSWMAVQVTMRLWRATRSTPFPPVVKTNIGREKLRIYDEECPDQPENWFREFDDSNRGHLWAWLETHLEWLVQLRRQVEDVCGPGLSPQKVLIVDEFVSSGRTATFAICLTSDAFPKAQVRFTGAYLNEWCQAMFRAWLGDFHPDILSQVPDAPGYNDPRQGLEEQITLVVPGTEDTQPPSLDWQPIRPGSELLDPLLRLLPADEWLRMIAWIEQTLLQSVDAFLSGWQPPEISVPDDGWLQPVEFGQNLVLMRETYAGRNLTSRRATELLGNSQSSAYRLLTQLCDWNFLQPVGKGRSRRYLKTNMEQEASIARPTPLQSLNAYWLVPGRVLVGRSPFLAPGQITTGLRRLTEEYPLVRIIFLGTPLESNVEEIKSKMGGKRKRGGKIGEIVSFDVPFPDKEELIENWLPVRKAIHQALQNDEVIYLQDNMFPDRTGIVAGLYLVEQGMTANQALNELERLTQGLPYASLPYPPRSNQRRLVRRYERWLKENLLA